MTANARNILEAFDALPPPDQQEVAAEILRRTRAIGRIPDDAELRETPSVSEETPKHTRPLIKLPEGTELVSETLIRERR